MRRSRALPVARLFLATAILLAATACETKNIGGGFGGEFRMSWVSFNPAAPIAGDLVTASIYFNGVQGPFTFNVHFGSSVTPADQTVTAPPGATGTTLTFTLDTFTEVDEPAGRDVAVTVTGTDAQGLTGTVSGTFHVTGIPDDLPTISTVFNAGTCTVTATVFDAEGEDVTIQATPPASLSMVSPQTVAGGNGSVDFHFSSTDIIVGGSGDVFFNATDTAGGSATSTIAVTCPGFDPSPADTLFAVPMQSTVAAGEPVTIVVITADPANPFQYMNGVRVSFPDTSGFEYVDNSFNVGAVGGAPDETDGFWTAMNPSGYLLAPDSFYMVVDAGGGLSALDFNVTPLGGNDVAAGSGALFNFQATFANAGTYDIGFQQADVVSRTYYTDGNLAPEYFWGDINNNAAGIAHSVTVQ